MTIEELRAKAAALDLLPGCYIMRDKKHGIIYIGKAKRLRSRVSSYFREGAEHTPKVAKMVSNVDDFDIIITDSEYEALVLECSLIKQHMPKYNIQLKDDNGFCYIRISGERYARITAELQKKEDGARYLGPYYSFFALKRMVETANTAFGLPTCTRRFPQDFGKERPCLNAHIGRCAAVCTGRVSEADYNTAVHNAVTLLTKGTKAILAQLTQDMQRASDALEFERAARLRDSISAIKKQDNGQKIIKANADADMDVFAFAGDNRNVCAAVLKFRDGRLCDKDERVLYGETDIDGVRDEFVSHYYISGSADVPRCILCDSPFESMEDLARMLGDQQGRAVRVGVPVRGDNHALVAMAYNNAADRLKRIAGRRSKDEAALAELANLLGLPQPPRRIEAFDISNYGDEAVAGMVVFADGAPKKADYRRFIIYSVNGVDDYASMQEALSRRARRYETRSAGFHNKPDVLLIDGGRGHLAAALDVLKDTELCDVPTFGMVKDDKHRTRGIVARDGELSVAMHKSAFALITRIQDETHRFTVDYQRKRHSKLSMRSSLMQIEGIGETRAKLLLQHFGTLEALRAATPAQLAQVKGMTERAAQAVFDALHT
ncbi:MAG: excinuclease ABC subunit UvrC [Oscillospiraceae bacterium]|nr:excinuclease ABC subunit UvrC [Oscillospiraceae bacterium]